MNELIYVCNPVLYVKLFNGGAYNRCEMPCTVIQCDMSGYSMVEPITDVKCHVLYHMLNKNMLHGVEKMSLVNELIYVFNLL